MDPQRKQNLKKTVEVFDMKIDDKMLPGGANPMGKGHLMANSENGLAISDVPSLVLGVVEPQSFTTEEGNRAWMEKMNAHARAFGRVRQNSDEGRESDLESVASYATSMSQASTVGEIANAWDEVMKAKNDGKFNAKKLKIIRKELDYLLKKAEEGNDSIASDDSASTWASFGKPTVKPIEKVIKGYEKMSLENKIEALKSELPPFNIEDYKYNNLKYALGKYHKIIKSSSIMC